MTEHKAWDWDKSEGERWLIPSEKDGNPYGSWHYFMLGGKD